MLVIVSVVLLCLTALVLPLQFVVSGGIDFFANKGTFRVRMNGLPLADGTMHIEQKDIRHNNLILTRNDKKVGEVHLSADKTDTQSIVSILTAPLFGNLNITDIAVNAEIGKNDDAFFSALAIGGLRLVYAGVVSVVKCHQELRSCEQFRAVYDKNVFFVRLDGIFLITLADIIYGAIVTVMQRKKAV